MEWRSVNGPCPEAESLQAAWQQTLAVPVLGPTHERRRQDARTWTATHEDHAVVCFRVDAGGVLFEMLADASTDSEFLAAAYREVGGVASVQRVAFRSDDSWLLPFTLTGRRRSEVPVRARLLVRAPEPWFDVTRWQVRTAKEASQHPDSAAATVVECAEEDSRLTDLLAAGFRDAVQWYEAPWRAGAPGGH